MAAVTSCENARPSLLSDRKSPMIKAKIARGSRGRLLVYHNLVKDRITPAFYFKRESLLPSLSFLYVANFAPISL